MPQSSWETTCRRGFAAAIIVVACLVPACDRPAQSRPDIVVISIDTLRPDHLSVYGHERPTSPFIDAFAGNSVLFERAYSQSPKTAPSHMSLMTGLYPEAHGVDNLGEAGAARRLSEFIPTLAGVLRDEGYQTIGFHNGGNVRADLGFDSGFDSYLGKPGMRGVAEAAMQALGKRGRKPLFLFLHTYDAHDPYLPPPEHAALFVDPAYAGAIVSDRTRLAALAGADWGRSARLYWSRVERENPSDVAHLRDLYDAAIHSVDETLGPLLAEIEETERDPGTIVVILSDHGEEFREHDGFLHDSLHEEVLRVPLLVRLPGERGAKLSGFRSRAPVALVDVMPTLLEAAGLALPAHLQGRSLLPLLAGQPAPERAIFSQWNELEVEALRTPEWKYIRKNRLIEELYDLREDAAELRNVARDEPDVKAAMRREVERLLGESAALAARFESYESGAPVALDALDEEARRQLEALGYLDPSDTNKDANTTATATDRPPSAPPRASIVP